MRLFAAAVATATLGLGSAQAASVNLLSNPGFETDAVWSLDNSLGFLGPCTSFSFGCAPDSEAGETMVGWLDRPGAENIARNTTQTVHLAAGSYEFGVYVALGIADKTQKGGDFSQNQVSVYAQPSGEQGVAGAQPNDVTYSYSLFDGQVAFTGWFLLSGLLTLSSDQDVIFNISLQQDYSVDPENPASVNDLHLLADNAYIRSLDRQLPAVPLPASALLLAGALGGLTLLRRKAA